MAAPLIIAAMVGAWVAAACTGRRTLHWTVLGLASALAVRSMLGPL